MSKRSATIPVECVVAPADDDVEVPQQSGDAAAALPIEGDATTYESRHVRSLRAARVTVRPAMLSPKKNHLEYKWTPAERPAASVVSEVVRTMQPADGCDAEQQQQQGTEDEELQDVSAVCGDEEEHVGTCVDDMTAVNVSLIEHDETQEEFARVRKDLEEAALHSRKTAAVDWSRAEEPPYVDRMSKLPHRSGIHSHGIPQGSAARAAAAASQLQNSLLLSASQQQPQQKQDRNPLNIRTNTRTATSWQDLDSLVERSILCDVPAEDLKPIAKALRSEKATMLLEGYLSEADKKALRAQPLLPSISASSSALSTARDTLIDSQRTHQPQPLGCDEDADPLQQFIDAENTIERRRFVGEKWLDKITLFQSLEIFRVMFQRRYREKRQEGVMTEVVKLGLRRWWRLTERRLRVQRVAPAFPKPPLALRLKKTCPFLIDWPLECIEELVAHGTPAVFMPGEALFHEDDPTQDVFLVCSGEVQAAVMCGGRAQRRCYVEGYLLRGEEDVKNEQQGSNYTNTTTNNISERSPPPAQPFTLLTRTVTNQWKKKERPAGNTGGSQPVRLVDHFLDGMLFGMDGLLAGTKEPRCYTAWATTATSTTSTTCVLRIPRASVFQAMSSKVADITRAVMQEAAWRLRHQYRYGAAFPIPIDILRRSSAVFQYWHVHALQELMAKAFIQVFRDGDVVCEQGVIAPVGASQLLVVLRGSLEVVDFGSLDPPNTLGPLGVLGEEELVLCGYPNRFTVKARQTTDVLTILQEHYLDVSSHNGECGEYARTAIANGIASRMIKSTNCPDALLLDPLANFLFPDALMRRVWAELAEPVFFLQGSGVMRTWDEAAYVYLFQTGTLFQQFGADGPQVPVVNLGDLLNGAVRDDDVQNIQTDMEEEDDIYNAINSPGAYFKPRRGGQQQGGAAASPPAPGAMPAAGPHVWVPLERNLIPGDTSSGGVLTGLMEFALGRPHSLSHLRATSHVVAWRWSRKKLETMVQEFYPQVWTAIQLQETRDVVRKHFLGMSLKNLKDEAAPRSAEQRRGTTITEDGNDKGVARIG